MIFKIVPLLPRVVVDLRVLEHGIAIDNIARDGVIFKIDRLSVTDC